MILFIADLTKKNVKGKILGDLIKKYSSERLELQKKIYTIIVFRRNRISKVRRIC